jgi:hypothetical protein
MVLDCIYIYTHIHIYIDADTFCMHTSFPMQTSMRCSWELYCFTRHDSGNEGVHRKGMQYFNKHASIYLYVCRYVCIIQYTYVSSHNVYIYIYIYRYVYIERERERLIHVLRNLCAYGHVCTRSFPCRRQRGAHGNFNSYSEPWI